MRPGTLCRSSPWTSGPGFATSLSALQALNLAERTATSIRELFPTLTTVTCDCCDETFVDEVALLMIEDAIVTHRDALREKLERDDAAWAEAEQQMRQALSKGAGGASG